jgi:hypothetical protein
MFFLHVLFRPEQISACRTWHAAARQAAKRGLVWSIWGAGGELRYSVLLAAEEALFYRC